MFAPNHPPNKKRKISLPQEPENPPIIVRPSKKRPTEKSVWLEIELVGEDDLRVSEATRCRIELPDGSFSKDFQIYNGFTRLDNLPEREDYKLIFPDLDREAWE